MKRGRPPKGEKLVEELEGSEHAKVRTRIVLETITGKKSIRDACDELSIQEARFHELKKEALSGMVESLEPQPAGRPAKMTKEEAVRIAELERENAELQVKLKAAEIREELARGGILPEEEPVKKKAKKKRRKKSW